MYCSRSITVHLLRGLGAVGLTALAFIYGEGHAWLLPPLLIGAVVEVKCARIIYLCIFCDQNIAFHLQYVSINDDEDL